MGGRAKRSPRRVNYQVLIGLTEDETAHFFSDREWSSPTALGGGGRDRYLRTLVRNNYDFHLNEIFATVQVRKHSFIAFCDGCNLLSFPE